MLSEGTRGPLTQAYLRVAGRSARENPQIFALGVKEIWETKKPLDASSTRWAGRCRATRSAAASCIRWSRTSSRSASSSGSTTDRRTLDVHALLQRMKPHPLLPRSTWRAASWSSGAPRRSPRAATTRCPQRRHGDGVLMVGDAAGFVDVASLKGIHYAMQSGIFAARAIFAGAEDAATRPPRRSRPTTRWWTRATSSRDLNRTPQHAARLQGRLLRGRRQGRR